MIIKDRGPWQDTWRQLLANKAAIISLLLISLISVTVTIGPALLPYEFDECDFDLISIPPDLASMHLFGTDSVGRDLLVRTLVGGRISMMIGIAATFVSLVIGVSYGAIAGYYGGRIDAVMMRFVDILYAMPFMFFVILLMVLFGRNILLVFVAIGAVNWLDMARIVRGQTLSLKRMEFVEAARACGISSGRIIRRHIIPNLLGVVVVYVTLTIPQVILVESFLSFLGLGVQEPDSSWGSLVNEGAQEMESSPWMLVFPAGFLVITLFCFNFIGDGVRDALDTKER